MKRLRLMLIVFLTGTPRLALAAVLYSEGFDSSAANVTVNQSIDSAVDYVDYSNFTVGATNFVIPEAPNILAGSAPTQGVLMRVNHTGQPGGNGAPAAINILAGTTPISFFGNYAISYDVYMSTSDPSGVGSTQQALFGLGTNDDATLEAAFNRGGAGTVGTWGWLTNENGSTTEDSAINQNALELADIGDQDAQDVQAGISPGLFNQAFFDTNLTQNNSAARQWVRVDLRIIEGQVSVLFNGIKFFGNSKNPIINSVANAGYAMLGFEDRFASISSNPDLSWALFDNFVVREVATTAPGIFKWEYVDPHNSSQGKQQSSDLTIDGSGLYPESYLSAVGKNLANAFLTGADLANSALISTNLSRAVLDQANLTNVNFTGANLTGATLIEAVLTGAIVKSAKLSSTHITLDQLYSTASYQNHDLTGTHFIGNDLSDANFAGQTLIATDFYAAKLVGANFANANLTNAEFINADLSQANLTGANLTTGSLALANLSHANLTNANLNGINLIGTNLAGADVRGARFDRITTTFGGCQGKPAINSCWLPGGSSTIGSGVSFAQLLTTASYQAGDLSGIKLVNNNLAGANFAGFNLSNANFSGAVLTGADLSGADARGAIFSVAVLTGANLTNRIDPDGHIAGLDVGTGQLLSVRDYDGDPSRALAAIAIRVDQHFNLGPGGTLRMLFEADAWDSTIYFTAGIPVMRSGTLELTFAADVDPTSQIGRTFDLFDWTGVSPTGTFAINSPHVWDLSNLYTAGQVTLLGAGGSGGLDAPPLSVPEPTAWILLCVGLVAMWTARRTRSTGALSVYRAMACHILPVGLLVVACNQSLAAPPEFQVTQIGSPVWKPVDFQLFSAPATPFNQEFGEVYSTLLPYDSPLAAPYVPHAPPYDAELSAGMIAGGYVSQSVFTADAITLQPNGVYFAYMLVPDPGTTGSSRDFASGPVIPNSLFPIANNVDVWLDGVLVDKVHGADSLIPVQPRDAAFQGTSHLEYVFAIWHPWDDDLSVGPLGNYDLRVSVRDVGGSGWDIVAPFQVVELGDFNHDNSVDAADYVAWRKTGGSSDEYNTWRTHFGETLNAGSGATTHLAPGDSPGANFAAPEPGSFTLLLLSVAGLVVLPRSRVVAKNRC